MKPIISSNALCHVGFSSQALPCNLKYCSMIDVWGREYIKTIEMNDLHPFRIVSYCEMLLEQEINCSIPGSS